MSKVSEIGRVKKIDRSPWLACTARRNCTSASGPRIMPTMHRRDREVQPPHDEADDADVTASTPMSNNERLTP